MHANEASNGLCDDAVDIAIRLPIMCYGGGVAELWIGGCFLFWLWLLALVLALVFGFFVPTRGSVWTLAMYSLLPPAKVSWS